MKYDRSLEVIYEMEERIHKCFLSREYSRDNYIYIYILSSIKNVIQANCLIIDDPLLLCNKDSQGVIINI